MSEHDKGCYAHQRRSVEQQIHDAIVHTHLLSVFILESHHNGIIFYEHVPLLRNGTALEEYNAYDVGLTKKTDGQKDKPSVSATIEDENSIMAFAGLDGFMPVQGS